jgi:hypothetical protein
MAALISVPVGVLIAIFNTEFAPPPVAEAIRIALNVLAGVPTIVIGIFIFGLLVVGNGQSAIAASVGLSIVMVHGDHRPVGLRQEHVHPLPEPDERPRPGARVDGHDPLPRPDLYGAGVDPVEVRRRIGMVFQRPNPFPKSIYDNVAWGRACSG